MKENKNIVKKPGDFSRVYCQEDYAQELYDKMNGIEIIPKDLKTGDVLGVRDFKILKDGEVEVICDNFDSLYFTLSKERKYFELWGQDEEMFVEWVQSGEYKSHLEERKSYVVVENVVNRRGSLYQAHLRTILYEFKNQILKPTLAYVAKITGKNQGGFMVEVQGIKAFMPGSLAAANKIMNFDSYIGKEVYVMIEDYLQASGMFVVSYKKYLDHILPSKLADLERNQSLIGTVTGSSKFGIFAEFEEIFTGLLHTAEMGSETLDKFNNREIRPGDKMEVWLKDIKDNKLILTEVDPSIRQNEMEEFRDKVEGNMKESVIVSIKPHGALMEIEKGVLGLLPVKEMKKTGRRLNVGETLDVFIKKVDTSTGKIYLTLHDEQVTTEV
jgi:predicted RNA-binding protein with RPS1 domain